MKTNCYNKKFLHEWELNDWDESFLHYHWVQRKYPHKKGIFCDEGCIELNGEWQSCNPDKTKMMELTKEWNEYLKELKISGSLNLSIKSQKLSIEVHLNFKNM